MWWLVYAICIEIEPTEVVCQRQAGWPKQERSECLSLIRPMMEFLETHDAIYVRVGCEHGGDA